MPSGEVTLQRIQREILEVKMREEELRKKYSQQTSVNGNDGSDGETNGNGNLSNGNVSPTPPSPVILTNGTGKSQASQQKTSQINGKTPDIALNLTTTKVTRRFAPNSTTKGVMQRFIKSKGKLAALTTLTSSASAMNSSWSAPMLEDTISPPKVEPGKTIRRGYVPVEERMKKEFLEMHSREHELKLERRKSQSDLLSMDEEEEGDGRMRQVVSPSKMRSARSVSHLSDSDSYLIPDDTQSEPCSLKPARSLAQLCAEDLDEEEVDAPGSLTLIRQWESLIQKNQQLRT